jgi:N-acetylmuramoyl-L-alanine amidase
VGCRINQGVFGAGLCALAATMVAPALAEHGSSPAASQPQIAADASQTRFTLDFDRRVPLRAYTLAKPDRVVIDLPQVEFALAPEAAPGPSGLIKTFRYGLVMPGASRMVFDLAAPATITEAKFERGASSERLVLELRGTDSETFAQSLPSPPSEPQLAIASTEAAQPARSDAPRDVRPIVVIDPGHGGIDNGTQAGGESEKTIVLDFARALRDRIEAGGKYRPLMTREDDTFIPLGERVKIARAQNAALFISIHADALPRREGDAQGATVYTLSERASDAEAERLAESENKSDAIGGVNLTEEPTEVADILIDLAQRETRSFSSRFARVLVGELKGHARLHKNPLKSAGFKVLKAPDVPSVLVELGYVTNKGDLAQMVSQSWRNRTVGALAQAIDTFFTKRLIAAGADSTSGRREATAKP